MRADRETTSPEAAGEFERNNTAPITDTADNDNGPHFTTDDPDPAFAAWLLATRQRFDRVRYEQTRSWRTMRCAHPHCRTSLDDETAVYCDHGLGFCRLCTWEEACDECAVAA